MNAPAPSPKQAEALRGLGWWAAERERVGTDWRTDGSLSDMVNLTRAKDALAAMHGRV